MQRNKHDSFDGNTSLEEGMQRVKRIQAKISVLIAQKNVLKFENYMLRNEIAAMELRNLDIRTENAKIRAKSAKLMCKNAELIAKSAELRAKSDPLAALSSVKRATSLLTRATRILKGTTGDLQTEKSAILILQTDKSPALRDKNAARTVLRTIP